METEPKSLFLKGTLPYFSSMKGKWHAKINGCLVMIQIYEQGLIQNNQMQASCRTIQFDFDLKYAFSNETLQISFERGIEKCVYNLPSIHDLQQIRSFLKQKINQRGFHQQFKPLKKIGKGNFASVYLAQKIEDGIHYAVKAFSKEAAYSEENGKQCLIKEIQIARCLNHPNAMKLFEVFQSENSLYIVFQLLSGGQLQDKVKTKYKFKNNQIQEIVRSILMGLEEMHTKGIMHRDLKPENLIFRKPNEWDCVIADYGLAEFSNISHYLFVRCGTPGYVAPEVINIKDMSTKYSPICDIYSLGLIFHTLLLGKSAFPGRTYEQVLAQNRAAKIDLTKEQYKKISPQALNLLSQMLKKNPNERISAKDALNHQYFNHMDPYKIEEEDILPSVISPGKDSNHSTIDSPLLTSGNPKRKMNPKLPKDSCVNFHIGKQNLLTGKTQEVESLKSNKVSICNAGTPLRKPKVSQFCANPNPK